MAPENESPTIGGDADLPRARRSRMPHAPLPERQTGPAPTVVIDDPPFDEDDPRTRAKRRADELRAHRGNMDEGVDKFYIDPRAIPDGWSYEWKTLTVYGKDNPSYQVSLARAGWEPVPAHRHPEMMPEGWQGESIERDGQILMERPLEITNEAKANELRKARNQVRQKEAQLNGQPAGPNSPFEATNKGNPLAQFKKSYEPMPIPKE